MFADDRGWVERIREAIDTGLTAGRACSAPSTTCACVRRDQRPYIGRLADLSDLTRRLLLRLMGRGSATTPPSCPTTR